MKLDHIRNRLLTADMIFTLISMCIAMASMVASFFGMNIRNGNENDGNVFYVTVFTTVAACATLAVGVNVYFRQSGLFVM